MEEEQQQFQPIEFRAVVRFLVLLGRSNVEIHEEMRQAYGDQVPTYRFVCKWARLFRGGQGSLEDRPRTGRPRHDDMREAIVSHLTEEPYATVRTMERDLGIPRTTVHRILVDELGLHKFLARWVPHSLSEEQKQRRVRDSDLLLSSLASVPSTLIITADESWFYHEYPHSGQWALSKEEVEQRPRRAISSKKTMVIIIMWGIRGPILVKALPEGKTATARFFVIYSASWKKECASSGQRLGSATCSSIGTTVHLTLQQRHRARFGNSSSGSCRTHRTLPILLRATSFCLVT